MNISVIVITRNRAALLDQCLSSIVKQTTSPLEVIVVDNDSTDQTPSTIVKYRKMLPMKSTLEKRIGIPYARNAGIQIAKGDVVAFLDDDCIANQQWILSINIFFSQKEQAAGVIGNTSPADNKSVSTLVEFAYNRRWIITHVHNPTTISKIRSGVVVDFKNAAFLLAFIRKFHFSARAPFGDAGSNEDAELGFRMFQENHNIYYNPAMKASHMYSASVRRLFWRNFWGGYGDTLLLLQNGIDLKNATHKPDMRAWILLYIRASKYLPAIQRIIFFLLIFMYPLVSRVGRVAANITWKFRLPLDIPQR